MHFSENITSARITPYTGVNYKKYIERSSMFKGAQIKLGGHERIQRVGAFHKNN
jgi:hypothetical protein